MGRAIFRLDRVDHDFPSPSQLFLKGGLEVQWILKCILDLASERLYDSRGSRFESVNQITPTDDCFHHRR